MVTDRYGFVLSGCFVAKHRTGVDGAASAASGLVHINHDAASTLLHVVT